MATKPGKPRAALRATPATSRPRRPIGRPAGVAVGRNTVLRAACQLLKKMPSSEVTGVAVARAMNADPALIRYYFRDHASLMLAAGVHVQEEFYGLVRSAIGRTDGSPTALLRARVAALLEISTRYPFVLRLMDDLATRNPKPDARRRLRQLTADGLDYYARLLQAGAEGGTLRQVEPLFLAMAVVGMCDVFSIQEPIFNAGKRLRAGSKAQLRQRYLDFMVDLILSALSQRQKST
jgi:AcrR family transcriptional regulator